MTVKERVIKLVQSMPDDDDRLQAAERVLEPNGTAGDDDPSPGPTFEERLAKLAETFAGMDFLPREDAWH
jgi:hypothetical protein